MRDYLFGAMPIYEYQCEKCGNVFEMWQKVSDGAPRACPKCKGRKITKLISHTSFQLKGTGWYATDFRGSAGAAAKADAGGGDTAAKTEDKPQPAGDAPASSPAPAPAAAAPAGGCGASCACH